MMSEQILFVLLRTSLAVALTSVLVVVVLKCCRCRSSRIHRIAWAFVLLQGVLWTRVPLELSVLSPPVLQVSAPSMETSLSDFEFETEFVSMEPVFITEHQVIDHQSTTRRQVQKSELRVLSELRPVVADVVLGLWLAGLLAALSLRCFGLYRLKYQTKSAKPASDELLHDKKIRILLTDHFGPAIFRNTIFVPETLWEESSESVRRGILKHELSHARHRDGLKSLLLSLVAMIHWFNPLAWLALKKFNEAAEWRCDSEAFGSEKNGLATFAESMLALSRCEPKYLAWVQAYKNQDIKERVRRLQEQHLTAKESTMKKLGILCLVAVLFGFGLVKVQLVAQNPEAAQNVQPQNEQPQNEPETVSPDPGTQSPARETDENGGMRQYLKRVSDSQLSLAVARAELATLEEANRMHPGSISVLEIEKAKRKIAEAELAHKRTKEETKKTDENEPSPAGAPPKLEIIEKDGEFYLKTETGDVEAAPLSSVPVPDMDESDYFIQSPAFRKIYVLGASLELPGKEEYQKLDLKFSAQHPKGGLIVRKLSKGFRADQAGIRPNDIIIGFDKYEMSTMAHLQYLSNRRAMYDTTLKLWILRNDKLYYVDIPVESMMDEPPADGGFMTGGLPGVSGFTHLVTFKPKGDFNPRNPGRFLAPFREKLVQEGPVTGYFRTKPVDGKLVGSLCTGDPEWLKRFIDTVPEIEFVNSERLTKESFEAYEKTKQESLPPTPPADGGFATPGQYGVSGFTHIVSWGPKGDFRPRTPGEYLRISHAHPDSKAVYRGYFRTKNVDGTLIASNLTDAPEVLRKMIESTPEFEYLKTERLTKESFEAYEKTKQESLPPADGGFASSIGHTHAIYYAPKGNFNGKTHTRLLAELNRVLVKAGRSWGISRVCVEDGRLVGICTTADPETVQKIIDASPNLKFLRAERLTAESNEELLKFKETNYLPAEDGGYSRYGQQYLIEFRPKGDFDPKTQQELFAELSRSVYAGYFQSKWEDEKLVGTFLTDDKDVLKEIIDGNPKLEFVKAERLTEKTANDYLNKSKTAADGGFAMWNGFTHLVAVAGKGDFVPKTKTQFSREISRVFQNSRIGFGVVRSRVEDGKLILTELTGDPEGFKKVVDASDTLQYVRTERLTKEFYDKYVQDYDDSHFLPPADGGFTWHGHRYIVAFRPKGNFNPKTWEDFNGEFNKYMPWAFAGMARMKPDGDRILMMELTDDADILKETMDQSPSLEFVSAERLTKENFEEYQMLPPPSFSGNDHRKRFEEMRDAMQRLREIRKTDWFQKLNRQQKSYVAKDEGMFAYVYDPKNYEVGNARDEFEKKWIERLEGPEPGHPGHSALSVYDEAIIGLAMIKSDKALPLLVKIACERIVKDNAHRHYATKALGMLGDPAAVPELIPLVYHFNWNTRFDAQVALVKLTGQNFGVDDKAWGEWYNANRAKLGKNLPEFDPAPVDWICGSDDPELKKWADREEQKKMDAR